MCQRSIYWSISTAKLQTGILAKASYLKPLDVITQHSEAKEAALPDQTKLSEFSDAMSAHLSIYQKSKDQDQKSSDHKSFKIVYNVDQKCKHCNILNRFAKVYWKK